MATSNRRVRDLERRLGKNKKSKGIAPDDWRWWCYLRSEQPLSVRVVRAMLAAIWEYNLAKPGPDVHAFAECVVPHLPGGMYGAIKREWAEAYSRFESLPPERLKEFDAAYLTYKEPSPEAIRRMYAESARVHQQCRQGVAHDAVA